MCVGVCTPCYMYYYYNMTVLRGCLGNVSYFSITIIILKATSELCTTAAIYAAYNIQYEKKTTLMMHYLLCIISWIDYIKWVLDDVTGDLDLKMIGELRMPNEKLNSKLK